jgi:hypothetical protein
MAPRRSLFADQLGPMGRLAVTAAILLALAGCAGRAPAATAPAATAPPSTTATSTPPVRPGPEVVVASRYAKTVRAAVALAGRYGFRFPSTWQISDCTTNAAEGMCSSHALAFTMPGCYTTLNLPEIAGTASDTGVDVSTWVAYVLAHEFQHCTDQTERRSVAAELRFAKRLGNSKILADARYDSHCLDRGGHWKAACFPQGVGRRSSG